MATIYLQLSYYSETTQSKHIGSVEVDLELHGHKEYTKWCDLSKEEQEEIEAYEAEEFINEIKRNEDY